MEVLLDKYRVETEGLLADTAKKHISSRHFFSLSIDSDSDCDTDDDSPDSSESESSRDVDVITLSAIEKPARKDMEFDHRGDRWKRCSEAINMGLTARIGSDVGQLRDVRLEFERSGWHDLKTSRWDCRLQVRRRFDSPDGGVFHTLGSEWTGRWLADLLSACAEWRGPLKRIAGAVVPVSEDELVGFITEHYLPALQASRDVLVSGRSDLLAASANDVDWHAWRGHLGDGRKRRVEICRAALEEVGVTCLPCEWPRRVIQWSILGPDDAMPDIASEVRAVTDEERHKEELYREICALRPGWARPDGYRKWDEEYSFCRHFALMFRCRRAKKRRSMDQDTYDEERRCCLITHVGTRPCGSIRRRGRMLQDLQDLYRKRKEKNGAQLLGERSAVSAYTGQVDNGEPTPAKTTEAPTLASARGGGAGDGGPEKRAGTRRLRRWRGDTAMSSCAANMAGE